MWRNTVVQHQLASRRHHVRLGTPAGSGAIPRCRLGIPSQGAVLGRTMTVVTGIG